MATGEAKAMAHPLRLRILRMCGMQELTNKQLADSPPARRMTNHLRHTTALMSQRSDARAAAVP